VWITSHHRGVVSERAAFLAALQAFAARIDERETRLLQMLGEGPCTLAELVRQRLLYPPHATHLWIDCAEERSIVQHLDELIAMERVSRDEGGRYALS